MKVTVKTAPRDLFIIAGRVHPNEYDWEKQFSSVIGSPNKECKPFVSIDVGKLAGLCSYIVELENELRLRNEVSK